jgi:hypothetical protein
MDRLEAGPRWRFGREYFEGLSQRAGELFMLVEVEGRDGGATALFLVVDDRAAYYLAARWGSERGASPFALWRGLEQLREAGVEEVLLGGGVSSRPDDPLLNFKTRFASCSVPLQLGGRIYDGTALHEALDRGQVRQPPRSSVPL